MHSAAFASDKVLQFKKNPIVSNQPCNFVRSNGVGRVRNTDCHRAEPAYYKVLNTASPCAQWEQYKPKYDCKIAILRKFLPDVILVFHRFHFEFLHSLKGEERAMPVPLI